MVSKFLIPYTLRFDFDHILDIGSGRSEVAAKSWLDNGCRVSAIDIQNNSIIKHDKYEFIQADFLDWEPKGTYQAVYASHILEHIQDTGVFLRKVHSLLSDDGVFFIVVPPFKHNIVGGHIHVWNMGLLMYNLILSGFDVVNGHFIKHGYNIVGIVRKSTLSLPKLFYDRGDIELLEDHFPPVIRQNISGDINEWNWFSD